MNDHDRIIQRVKWLDRTAKLVLYGGFVLPLAVVGILLARGWPPDALVFITGVIPFIWWLIYGMVLLLKATSLWQSMNTYPEHDPQRRRVRSSAVRYTMFCVLVSGALLLLVWSWFRHDYDAWSRP